MSVYWFRELRAEDRGEETTRFRVVSIPPSALGPQHLQTAVYSQRKFLDHRIRADWRCGPLCGRGVARDRRLSKTTSQQERSTWTSSSIKWRTVYAYHRCEA